MEYVEAVNDWSDAPRPYVFVAGGITDCPPWQWDLAALLEDLEEGTLLQPRRRNFPIDDPSAAQQQIEWEHAALHDADVFSMWFCSSTSVQPICMYELGSHLATWSAVGGFIPVIGVEPGYIREQDVRIQSGLVDGQWPDAISESLEEHAEKVAQAVRRCINYRSREREGDL